MLIASATVGAAVLGAPSLSTEAFAREGGGDVFAARHSDSRMGSSHRGYYDYGYANGYSYNNGYPTGCRVTVRNQAGLCPGEPDRSDLQFGD
jgi:hypothetical protein